jgi:hypothetical protein
LGADAEAPLFLPCQPLPKNPDLFAYHSESQAKKLQFLRACESGKPRKPFGQNLRLVRRPSGTSKKDDRYQLKTAAPLPMIDIKGSKSVHYEC